MFRQASGTGTGLTSAINGALTASSLNFSSLVIYVSSLRKIKPTTYHLPKEFLCGVTEERDAADQELVEYYAHGPPIHWLAVALDQDHFRSNILRSTTDLQRDRKQHSACFWEQGGFFLGMDGIPVSPLNTERAESRERGLLQMGSWLPMFGGSFLCTQ